MKNQFRILLVILLCVGFGARAQQSANPAGGAQISVSAELATSIESIRVVSPLASRNSVFAGVQNVGQRVVHAFEVRCAGIIWTQEFLPPHDGIAPSQIYQWREVLPLQPTCRSDTGALVIQVSGVLFDNGAAEGEPDAIKRLRAMRHGRLLALKLLQPILERLVNSSATSVEAVDNARSEVLDVALMDGGKPARGFVLTGMHTMKEEVVAELASIVESGRTEPIARATTRESVRNQAHLLQQYASVLQLEESP